MLRLNILEQVKRNTLQVHYMFVSGDEDFKSLIKQTLDNVIDVTIHNDRFIKLLAHVRIQDSTYKTLNDYDSYLTVNKTFGVEDADLWDKIPNDPITDWSNKCKYIGFELYYWNNVGDKFRLSGY